MALFGEAPDENEDEQGRPFVGASGRELDRYLSSVGLSRSSVYVSNAVKCRPPRNRTPKPHELSACRPFLAEELAGFTGRVVGAVGASACAAILGPDCGALDKIHGIPQRTVFEGRELVVVPMFHPALGMRDTAKIALLQKDFQALADTLRGRISPEAFADPFPDPCYAVVEGFDSRLFPPAPECIEAFVDTETLPNGAPWSVQIAWREGEGYMAWANDADAVAAVKLALESPHVTTVLHNAKFDLRILGEMGIRPARIADSMVAAYTLQDQPQGLKPLAYRLGRMEMESYLDVTRPATQARARAYLERIQDFDFPEPEPLDEWSPAPEKRDVLEHSLVKCTKRHKDAVPCPAGCGPRPRKEQGPEACLLCEGAGFVRAVTKTVGREVVPGTENGHWKTRRPWNLGRLIKRMLGDFERSNGETDLWERWSKLAPSQQAQGAEAYGFPLRPCGLDQAPRHKAVYYACRDADATARIWPKLKLEMACRGVTHCHDLDCELIPLVLEMERVGMLLDLDALAELSAYYKDEIDRLAVEINEAAGYELNPGSAKQLCHYFYGAKGYRPPETTPAGEPSTNVKALEALAAFDPVASLVLQWRAYSKNRTTYAEALPKMTDANGRIHPDILLTRTKTGRLACKRPNLQNVPKRSKEGEKLRACFVPRPGCVLVSGDYAQVEMRMAAHAGNDAEMIRIFEQDLDLHRQTAAKMFGVDYDAVDEKTQRYPAKRVGFGVLYQISGQGLADQMNLAGAENWTAESCQALIDDWFNVFSGIKSYFREKQNEARRHKFVTDVFGRRYGVPETASALRYIRSAGLRQACSYPIQGAAQTVMKKGMVAMIPVMEKWRAKSKVCDPLIQIHDDLVWEVSEDIADAFMLDFKNQMEAAVTLRVPLKTDAKKAVRWSDL